MSSLNPKDRVSLCLFSFTDGRRCRTPRTRIHPHFCFYHAQKEARANAAEKLAKDLAYFFSGDYLSACDLSTALSRLIPAVIRGDIKPKLGRTVAYMCQTLMQTIHLSQDEYINAFDSDGWREAVRKSVNMNSDYDNPQSEEAEESDEPEQNPPQPQQPAQAQQPTSSSPQPPSRPQQSRPATPQPATSTPQPRSASRPSPATVEEALSIARSLFPPQPNSAPPQCAPPPANPAGNDHNPRLPTNGKPL
jgi:hypothetical protein